jgi:hypothetical protein
VSVAVAPALRTLAFGDLQTGIWGAAWAGPQQFLALGGPGTSTIAWAVTVGDAEEGEDWRLSGDGVELVFAPVSDAARAPDLNAEVGSFDQLCRVSGRLLLDGVEHEVQCGGRRGSSMQAVDLQRFESVRDVSAWFEPPEGLAVRALRPRNVPGHDGDLLTVALLDTDGPVPVADPRLSTTYTATGQPSRVSLELWLGDDESEEQFQRRAAGQAVGAGGAFEGPGLEVRAELLRWHSRGQEGTGMYLLVRGR